MIPDPRTKHFGETTVALTSGGQSKTRVMSSPRERDAILAGVGAADAALERARRFVVLEVFVRTGQPPRVEPKLETLRAYAVRRRGLLPQGHIVSATSLSAAGFTAGQIAQFNAMITATPTRSEMP